jgi:hypothetical protein
MARRIAGLGIVAVLAAIVGQAACTDSGHPLDFSLFPECKEFGSNCLPTPNDDGQPLVATRSPCDADLTFNCDTSHVATPALACLNAPVPPASTSLPQVTLTGFVHVYSYGPDTISHTTPIESIAAVQVFRTTALAAGQDPAVTTPLAATPVPVPPPLVPNKPAPSIDPTERRACDADVRIGCSIPAANGCTQTACNDGLSGRRDDQKYCRDLGGGQSECSDRLRWEDRYTIAHVPTNTELAIRVTGPNGTASSPWANTMNANVILLTSDRACTSTGDSGCLDTSTTPTSYRLDVEVVSQADYENLPAAAQGIISKGHGAIFGELHDCDDVRVGNVIVGTQPESQRFTYYNGDPIHTAPDIIRSPMGTDRLGKFAAIDFAPGAVDVQTNGLLSTTSAARSLGGFHAMVYPSTITLLTINGGRPSP